MRGKRIFVLTPALSLLLAAGCTSTETTSDNRGDIVVGASIELTGANAEIGTAYEQALRLKVDQLNDSGALRGHTIRLDVRDNRGDASVATSQMTEFGSNTGVTAAVMGVCVECVVAAAPAINDKRLPTVALAPSSQVDAPVSERQFIFKLAPNVDQDATTLFEELGRARPAVRTIGLLTTTDAYGTGARETMIHELDGSPIHVGPVAQVNPTDVDLGPAVRTITQVKTAPEAVVVMAFPAQARLAITELRGAGFKGQIYLDASAAGDLFLPASAAASAENATLVFTQTLAIDDVIATTPAKAARKQWFQDYTARYGSYYAQASFAADAVQLIADAVGRAGSTDRTAIRAAMETAQFDGLTGPIRLAPENHSGLTPQSLTVLVARGGRWRLVA
ncbi:ABC transporter substrate-binding protein [Dactylosporangium sp. CA-092794]|uniref:ABC transporter substrate-binding protein n=1 Tax=Dactylosporangium sp. CA-092794 TaxID=3239929 RepID=UPI003D8CA02B